MIVFPAALTGSAQTNFTSPVFNNIVDTPPDVNSKQVAITSLGGTMAGVDAHSVSRPFTLTFTRPKVFGVLGKPNPTTGLIASVPRNIYKFLTRKGVTPLAAQPSQVGLIRTEIEVPAGSDTADLPNLRAMISAHIGGLTAFSAGLGDTVGNGVV